MLKGLREILIPFSMKKSFKFTILSHEKSQDLSKTIKLKIYSEPVIYTANNDLDKYWYVYFSYRNPQGYLQRMPNIYAPKHLDRKDRLAYLKTIKSNLSDMLKEGFNPFDVYSSNVKSENHTVSTAFKFALEIKKQTQNETSFKNFESRIKRFEKWLLSKFFVDIDILNINKKVANDYLNEILIATSPRNRNNTKTDLQSLFQVLEDNDIIEKNVFVTIKKLASNPEKNKPFTFEQERLIFDYIDKNNLSLLKLYINHISWAFFRPVECNRLIIEDIVQEERVYRIKTKTGFKIKIIPDILFKELPDLSDYKKDSFLFGFNGFGQYWEAMETNRRNHYNRLFLEVKKAVKITGKEYGFYSFRHTNITRLYNQFIKEMTPDEAESKLMTITQHQTKDALRKYLREINAYRPEDYSEHFKNTTK